MSFNFGFILNTGQKNFILKNAAAASKDARSIQFATSADSPPSAK